MKSSATKYYITHKSLGTTYEVESKVFGNDDVDTEKVEEATVSFVTADGSLEVTFDNTGKGGIEKMSNSKWTISDKAPTKGKVTPTEPVA